MQIYISFDTSFRLKLSALNKMVFAPFDSEKTLNRCGFYGTWTRFLYNLILFKMHNYVILVCQFLRSQLDHQDFQQNTTKSKTRKNYQILYRNLLRFPQYNMALSKTSMKPQTTQFFIKNIAHNVVLYF